MFQVKRFNANGELIEIIPPEKLIYRHVDDFTKTPQEIKKKKQKANKNEPRKFD